MGTRGYRVYRYKKRYLVIYNHFDSYPEGLGVEVLHSIPSDPEAFQIWLENMRSMFEARVAELGVDDGQASYDEFISTRQPRNDLFIEWIYEMDLDNLIFHVDSSPLFRLDHMPPTDVFLECISFDHYGERAYAKDTPEEYRYDCNWNAPPPVVSKDTLEVYKSLNATSASIREVLAVQQEFTSRDAAHVRLIEICVGSIMLSVGTSYLRHMERIRDRSEMSEGVVALAMTFMHNAIRPLPLYLSDDEAYRLDVPSKADSKIWWTQTGVCVQLSTHLGDQRNLQAAISTIVAEMMARTDQSGAIYGVVFSVFHCAIVCVDQGAEANVKHTPALQFLPSYYAESPSTPGITALAHLGRSLKFNREDLSFLYHHIFPDFQEETGVLKSPTPTSRFDSMPPELLSKIAGYLVKTEDLLAFALSSERAASVAEYFLRYPHLNSYSLLSEVEDESDLGHIALTAGYFGTAFDGGETTIAVGVDSSHLRTLLTHVHHDEYRDSGSCVIPTYPGLHSNPSSLRYSVMKNLTM